MICMVKLVLMVEERQAHQLHAYGQVFKHEVYKVAGVFRKQQKVFAFPYRTISNAVAWDSKGQVVQQAAHYYRMKQRHRQAKLDYIAVWSEASIACKEGKQVQFLLGKNHRPSAVTVPFECDESALIILHRGRLMEMTVKQRGEHWFAFAQVAYESTW